MYYMINTFISHILKQCSKDDTNQIVRKIVGFQVINMAISRCLVKLKVSEESAACLQRGQFWMQQVPLDDKLMNY